MTTRERNMDVVGRRDSFARLVNLLHQLKVTHYVAIPTMSNPYHTVDVRTLAPYAEVLRKAFK